jgi:replicative DNA helicase
MRKPRPVETQLVSLEGQPPVDLDAERQTLGSLILDPRRVDEVAELVKATDFYDERHEAVFTAIVAMNAERRAIDACTLAGKLKQCGKWCSVGAACLAEILHSVPVAAHAVDYAERVVEFSKRRKLRTVGLDAIRGAHFLTTDIAEAINATEAALAAIETGEYNGSPATIAEACYEALERAQEAASRKRGIGLTTGFPNFDHLVGGLFSGELVILAARPGVGKTSLACQIAIHAAQNGRGVYFASLEMDAAELAMRLICEATDIDSRVVRRGDVRDEELALMVDACNRLSTANLWIDRRPRVTVRDLLRTSRRLQSHDLGLVVVTSQRLVPEDRKQDRHLQIAGSAKGLKAAPRIVGACSVPLSAWTRGREERQTELHHLRESGDVRPGRRGVF